MSGPEVDDQAQMTAMSGAGGVEGQRVPKSFAQPSILEG
jgi:hypothetical protein